MYQSVAMALVGLLVYAVVASMVGWLSFPAWSLFAGLIVLAFSTLLSSVAIAYIFGKKPHYPSSIITGLILVFIFTPAVTIQEYLIFGLVGLFAGMSKYLLAWNGRHVFNPAAIAAAVVLLVGVSAASWWVATPIMLPALVILGGLLTIRLGRVEMVSIFIAVSIIVDLVVLALQGVSVDIRSVWMLVASYPIIYLACFMLTEPLTQPARRWQRNVVVAGVAVLAGLQISLGNVFITPEIALVVGNLLAFVLVRRRGIELRFVRSETLTGDYVKFIFRPVHALRFTAGQYMEFTIMDQAADKGGYRRMFTVASGENDDEVAFITKIGKNPSNFKKALTELKKGVRVSSTGIYGDFVLPKKPNEKLLWIAGGIGVTPFLSQAKSLADSRRDIVMLYYVRSKDEAIGLEELKDHGVKVRVMTERINERDFSVDGTQLSGRSVYISGPPAMVDTAKDLLKSLKYRSIKTDQFDGY